MATEKKVEKSAAEKAKLALTVFCIVLAAFGAFACYFGVTNLLNATALAAASEGTPAGTISTFCAFIAAAGLMKIALGVMTLINKGGKKTVQTLNIINLVFVVAALIALAKAGPAFAWTGAADLLLSLAALIWLSERLVRYCHEMLGEVKKLTWLTGKELVSHTVAVLVFVVAMALVIYVLDLGFSAGMRALESINIG